MGNWMRLTEPVAFLTALAAGAAILGTADGVPDWVKLAAAMVIAVAGAFTRSLVTPLSDPKDSDGNQLIADK